MKRVILLFIAIVFAWFVGCVKEAELPPLDFKFAVDSPNESFADKGVNEAVTLSFEVKADYYFSKVPMKYKIETDKDASISVGEKNILPNEIYTLENPKLSLSYVGKVAGQHNVKIIFFNGDTKKDRVTKEFKLKFIEYDYALEELSGKHTVFQGERTNFDFRLTPKNNEDDKNYTIIFKSYDEADIKLERNKIFFNGEGITFNKVYSIADLSKFTVSVLPFHVGNKELKYVIKNKTGKREGVISLEVKKNTLEVSGELDKTPIGLAGEVVNFVATINKSPLHIRKVWYKTGLSQGTPGGIEVSDWKEVSYGGNSFKIPIKILKNGSYQYRLEFKDEFGNVVEKIIGINSVANYKFRIEVEGGKNPFNQGEEVTYKINLVREDSRIAATYKIVFDEGVEGDGTEKLSVITVGGTKISGSTYLVQTDNSNPTNVKYYVTVKVKSFSIGAKKLNFKVFRNAEGVEAEKVTGSINFEVQKSLFKLEQELLDKSIITNSNEVITHASKMVKANAGNPVKYKVSIIEGDRIGVKDSDVWRDTNLVNGVVKIPINLLREGVYKYRVLYKDEFENEIVGGVKQVELRGKETFKVSSSFSSKRITPERPFSAELKVKIDNKHYSSVNYFVSSNSFNIIYEGKKYNLGERVPVKLTEVRNNEFSFVFESSFINASYFLTFHYLGSRERKGLLAQVPLVVENSDDVKVNIFSESFPPAFYPLELSSIKAGYEFNEYNREEGVSDCWVCEDRSYYYYRENVFLHFSKPFMNDEINKEDVKFKIFIEKKREGRKEIGLFDFSFLTGDLPAVVLDSRLPGFIKNRQLNSRDYFFEALYKPIIDIEIYYKNKKVYSIENINIYNATEQYGNINSHYDPINIEYIERTSMKEIRLPKGRIFYENYDELKN